VLQTILRLHVTRLVVVLISGIYRLLTTSHKSIKGPITGSNTAIDLILCLTHWITLNRNRMAYKLHRASGTSNNLFEIDFFVVTRRCQCGGRSLLIKKRSCCTLLQVFQVQIFSNVMRFLMLRKNRSEREYSCSQPPSSRINVVCTNGRFIISPTKNCQKGRIEMDSVLPLCLGNTARHLQLLHPSD
jgi:hypothetical protein